MEPTPTSTHKKPILKRIARSAFLVLFVVAVFGLGVGIGNGTISLSRRKLALETQNQILPADLNYASVEQVYDALRVNYDGKLDVQTLLNGLKNGLAKAADDSYTEYLNEEEAAEFDEELNGSFDGIGAELTKEDDLIVIVSPIAGYPAAEAGLKPKDVITEINGEPAYDLTVTEAVKKIRGKAGTKVKLTIVRDKKEELEFEIARARITIPSVKHEVLSGNIGYMQISRFGDDTVSLARQAAEEFKSKNVKGVILDVRGNPGGLLQASVDVASLWLANEQTVLEEKRGGVVTETLTARGKATLSGIPTVVLIDEGSASASEIVAGALADNKVATLMGMKTFGKGSVQGLEEIASGGVLKVTIARWYTPSGHNIDKQGIEPSKKVEITEKDLKAGRDPQKDAALKFLQK